MHKDIDTDMFIDEVEKRPTIWNRASTGPYSNKSFKRQAWEDIVSVFCDENDSKEKKKYMGILLQNKWRNLRDSFVKATKKEKSNTSKSSQYTYITRLQFLKTNVQEKETHSNVETARVTNNETVPKAYNDPTPPTDLPLRAKKIKTNESDDKFLKILEKSMKQRQLEFIELARKNEEGVDEEKLFCLSLVNEIKKIPEHKRLKAKIDVLNVLLQYQNMQDIDFNYSSQHAWSTQPFPSDYVCTSEDIKPGTPLSTASSDDSTIELFVNKIET